MKRFVLILLFTFVTTLVMSQNKFISQWKKIDSLQNIGQVQKALEQVSEILNESRSSGQADQYLKALLFKIRIETSFEEEQYKKTIGFLDEEIKKSQSPLKHILYSVLAQVYHSAYENNSWSINERTTLQGKPSEDIDTWDTKTFMDTCRGYYLLSLSEPEVLKKTALNQYETILEGIKETRKFRPSLYDFLVFRAIDFFTNEQATLSQPSFAFKLNDEKYFAPYTEFVKLVPETKDIYSFDLQAFKLFQELLSFHQHDKTDLSALVDADLKRLGFIYQKSVLANREALYLAALKQLAEKYGERKESADVWYQLAELINSNGDKYQPLVSDKYKWDKKEALQMAENTIKQFPATDGALNCRNLAEQIKLPNVVLTGNHAVPVGKPSLMRVQYKNVNKLWFRCYTLDYLKEKNNKAEMAERIEGFLKLKPSADWNLEMPSDGDYQSHSAEIKIPALASGYYVILASVTPDFKKNTLLSYTYFWSTGLSIINKTTGRATQEIMVLNRLTGVPVQKVTVLPVYTAYDYRKREYSETPGQKAITDKNGVAGIKSSLSESNNQFYLVLKSNKDQYVTENYYQGYYHAETEKASVITKLFTDRAIYRPGQPIYFKGIVLEKTGNKASVKPSFKTTVKFNDVNGQQIAVMDVKTNEFGSFSGIFTAPLNSLTGAMTLSNEFGSVSVRVEEYKRPRFETVFKPVTGSFKTGSEVTVIGKATAYAGSSISDATVKYRVVRNVRYPWIWWGFYRPQPSAEAMEITEGVIVTDNSGTFKITFRAIADENVDKSSQPTFDYSVYADVTDINGETHSAETVVSVGYQSLLITTDLPDDYDISKGFAFSLKTTNLQSQPEKSSGTINLFEIMRPQTIYFTRKWEKPDKFTLSRDEFVKLFPGEIYNNEDNIEQWKKTETLFSMKFSTPSDSLIKPALSLKPGLYLAEIKATDVFGEEVVYKKYFNVYDPVATKTTAISPLFIKATKEKAEPGETVSLILASPLKDTHVIVETNSKSGKYKRSFYKLDNNQVKIGIPVLEEDRGNIGINIVFIKNNRIFYENKIISVPFTNKELDIAVKSFRSKLEPGQQEEWQVTIKDKKGEKAVAEMVAGMYDASLDEFVPHNWFFSLNDYFYFNTHWGAMNGFETQNSNTLWYPQNLEQTVSRDYEQMIDFISAGYGRRLYKSAVLARSGMEMEAPMMITEGHADSNVTAPSPPVNSEIRLKSLNSDWNLDDKEKESGREKPSAPLSKPRTDFNETAFFFPQLATNSNGELVIKFKMPESLTRWRMMGLAHTKDLKTGLIERSLVTQKDLMLFPNPPRFLREGDKMQFQVKISNVSDSDLEGKAELHFFEAATMKPVDQMMGLKIPVKDFKAEKGGSVAVEWEISVPSGLQAVVYSVSASSGKFSDGEESALPVLTNRMLATESLPLPVRGNSTKSFSFDKLSNPQKSGSLKNYRLTLEYTSNPAWYGVQALPYLMEYPYECAEQLFSRYYANTLAGYIANSNPKIKKVFEAWKMVSPEALKSNLEKNEELKSVLLQESPWVRDAINETERKQRLGVLFDLNRMAGEKEKALAKLKEMQTVNGGWPWFQGMPESNCITKHIVSGFGHLLKLKALDQETNPEMANIVEPAIEFIDREQLKSFELVKKLDKDYLKNNHLGYDEVQYLYARTFFTDKYPLPEETSEMISYYKSQAVKNWISANNHQKAMISLFLNRLGDKKTASLILQSLAETSLKNEEMGMYWRNNTQGWRWFEAPVETQALIIEAFDEVLNDVKTVDELKVWLLKQKQTQDWKTTKATTEAVYALLLRGTDFLSSDKPVEIKVGNIEVNSFKNSEIKPEPGTGYFKTTWGADEIKPEMAKITVSNPNPVIAWGAVYWQYFENLDKITPAQTPLKLGKTLFREINTPTGPALEPVSAEKPLKTGDKIVVRITLTADRDMEYIHLKDMRASAFEPVNVLSGYRWQGGLGYYESTRDAATNFFIHYLPKGTYVFEYKLNATQKGDFSNGITSVQCMYAPEFTAHSEGIRVKVE